MKIFRVVDLSTGEVATEYVGEEQLQDPTNPFNDSALYSTTVVWSDEAPDQPIPPHTPPALITKLAFRNRFTQAEKVGIEIASLDNPSAPMLQRAQAAALRAAQADQRDATYIDLDRADTRAGVEQLEVAGLIAAGRAAQILDTPPTEAERWHG